MFLLTKVCSQILFFCTLQHTATHCSTRTATQCHILQHTAAHCNSLQHTTAHCNTLQHRHSNTLQDIATQCVVLLCFILLTVRKINHEASSRNHEASSRPGVSPGNFSKTLDFYYVCVCCIVLLIRHWEMSCSVLLCLRCR